MNAIRRLQTWRAPATLGPGVLLLVTIAGVFGVLWGVVNPPRIEIVNFDAGDLNQFAIHRVVAYADKDLYLVGMEDGSIRAIDGRVQADGCRVAWLPEDPRGAARNPQGLPGVFEDPCTHAVWSFEGNAVSGTDKPLRTQHVEGGMSQDGRTAHIFVELINPTK